MKQCGEKLCVALSWSVYTSLSINIDDRRERMKENHMLLIINHSHMTSPAPPPEKIKPLEGHEGESTELHALNFVGSIAMLQNAQASQV